MVADGVKFNKCLAFRVEGLIASLNLGKLACRSLLNADPMSKLKFCAATTMPMTTQ
jgi:hypothetical protein